MKLLRRTLIASAAALFASGAAQAATTVGQPAPDFTLKDATGKTVRLSDFKGKHVVLEWTNPGCPFVRKHYDSGNMPATQKDAASKNVVWLAVNSTEKASSDYLEPAKLTAWLTERKAQPTAVLMDEEGTVGKSYGARTTPHMYIVNPQGVLVYAGGIDSIPSARPADIEKATNYVKVGLSEALAGKPISAATTQPYGCSIKYKS
ncbi:thioredoxin family protein [Acidovorax sp. sic0104]|uniref:thioredoxin family protein n=1 Tax=Acidovorax sp. sic0104 TaxID=2854784 RepID=UPI001C493915|nr:thioredoxin family protein [Acidovorax sp. sic0104]MBV7542915.1 thioredoxin family protein [Acidovorax sp. sic0104]